MKKENSRNSQLVVEVGTLPKKLWSICGGFAALARVVQR